MTVFFVFLFLKDKLGCRHKTQLSLLFFREWNLTVHVVKGKTAAYCSQSR